MNNKNFELAKFEQVVNNTTVILELAKPMPNTEVLKQYKGFGGIGQCFQSEKLTGMVLASIRQVFGEDEEVDILGSIKNTCKSAYYTPPEIIQFIYSYLVNVCNFKGGDILEPACGIGAFIEGMPQDIKQNSKITAIEMDVVTSRILEGIYQDIEVINKPLQEVNFADTKYDLIIGNPPYSAEIVNDLTMPDISNNYTIHHYFIAKCIRLLNDYGILAFVMPSFFMDITVKHTRHIIDNEAVLIDAIRLPDNLFNNARVTVDIVFFRKTGNKKHNFVESVEIQQNNARDYLNKYWLENPHRVLGKHFLKWVEVYKRYVPCCTAEDSQKVLNYLKTCSFDEKTLTNFAEIIKNNNNEIISDNVKIANELADFFIEIEELEISTRNNTRRLAVLHENMWNLIKRLNTECDGGEAND